MRNNAFVSKVPIPYIPLSADYLGLILVCHSIRFCSVVFKYLRLLLSIIKISGFQPYIKSLNFKNSVNELKLFMLECRISGCQSIFSILLQNLEMLLAQETSDGKTGSDTM